MPNVPYRILVGLLLASGVPSIHADSDSPLTLADPTGAWRAEVTPRGLNGLEFRRSNGWQRVAFRSDAFAGPAWQVFASNTWQTIALQPIRPTDAAYEAVRGPLRFGLRYEPLGHRLAVQATVQNLSSNAVGPLRAGLRLGLDTYMASYPQWRAIHFPTLLRCEPTHFWGYAMSPEGRVLGISSPDRIASWHHDYKPLGHRIYTTCLDLLQPPPLPARHPQDVHTLAPGELRVWTIFLEDAPALDAVKPQLAATARAPMLDLDPHTVEAGGVSAVRVFSASPVAGQLTAPDGRAVTVRFNGTAAGVWSANLQLGDQPGAYQLRVQDERGRTAEATLSVRHPWSWYLQQARREAVAKQQKASSHTESWYGLFPAFHARRLFPDVALDAAVEAKFQELWPLMYDATTHRPTSWHDRIQNHACAAGLLAARYRATQDVRDLEGAAALCDFLLTKQTPDGAYRNKQTRYTSVIYIGKSILEVMAEERRLARTDPAWQVRFDRHYDSVRRAMDELAAHRDNTETEGEPTYEDGMIACSYSQLALFALWQTDLAERAKYLAAAQDLAAGHRCLSQELVPDSRMHGASLRFWEAQYDVLATPNMMNSPHGWSAWRIYGLWYLYRLTGQEAYLRDAYDALGTCVQLIEPVNGELRWSFVADPFVEASLYEPDPARPGVGRWQPRTVGEQYLPMISGWFRAPSNTWVTGYWATKDQGKPDGGCCDNDVHEIFKCLEEVALTVCHVVERPGRVLATYNGRARMEGDVLVVEPAESCVAGVHVNLRRPTVVRALLQGQWVEKRIEQSGWLGRAPSL